MTKATFGPDPSKWQIVLSPDGLLRLDFGGERRQKRPPDWGTYEPPQPHRKATFTRAPGAKKRKRST